MTSLDHITVLHGMNACRLVEALKRAEDLRLPLIQAAIAKAPKCEVGECQVRLDPAKPSGWIVEWFNPTGKHIRSWCCDDHFTATTDLNQMRRASCAEPVGNL